MIRCLPSEKIEQNYGHLRNNLVLENGKLGWFSDFYTDDQDYYFKIFYTDDTISYVSCVAHIVDLSGLERRDYLSLFRSFWQGDALKKLYQDFSYKRYVKLFKEAPAEIILNDEQLKTAEKYLECVPKDSDSDTELAPIVELVQRLANAYRNKNLPYCSAYDFINLDRIMKLRDITAKDLVRWELFSTVPEVKATIDGKRRITRVEGIKLATFFSLPLSTFVQ